MNLGGRKCYSSLVMSARGVLSLFLVAAAAASTHARPVATGESVEMLRRSAVRPVQILDYDGYWPDDETATFTTYGTPPREGTKFAVLDEDGWLATVEVTDIDEQEGDIADTTNYMVTMQVLQHNDRESMDYTYAVGPLSNTVTTQKLRSFDPDGRRVNLPDGSGGDMRATIDLDGDGEPDVVKAVAACPRRSTPMYDAECIGVWLRTPGGVWEQTELFVQPQ
jgi:hypothetical protein